MLCERRSLGFQARKYVTERSRVQFLGQIFLPGLRSEFFNSIDPKRTFVPLKYFPIMLTVWQSDQFVLRLEDNNEKAKPA